MIEPIADPCTGRSLGANVRELARESHERIAMPERIAVPDRNAEDGPGGRATVVPSAFESAVRAHADIELAVVRATL